MGDHLGSASLVTDGACEALCKSGAVVSEVRYSAFPFQGASRSFQDASRGEMRYLNGETVTDLLYTGQKLEEELGLYYYVARWYDPRWDNLSNLIFLFMILIIQPIGTGIIIVGIIL